MWTWKGNTGSLAVSSVYGLPMVIESFTLVNKSASTIGVNVYLIDISLNQFCIAPLNQQLATGEMYENERNIVVLATEQIKIHTSGSTDYNFTIDNLQSP